jgi:hypothetical protein
MVDIRNTITWNLVYEDPDAARNLTASRRWVTPNTRMVYDSWVHARLVHQLAPHRISSINDRPDRYMYPIGLFNAPRDWTAEGGPFSYLPAPVLQDAQAGKVLFILDQSQEGNADTSLWNWFYMHCKEHSIDPTQVIYLTSDHLAEQSHEDWCRNNSQSPFIRVISSWFNLHIRTHCLLQNGEKGLDFQQWINLKDESTCLYNCLNRLAHDHRRWFWLKLLEDDLLCYGMVSMDRFDSIAELPGVEFDPWLLEEAKLLLPMTVDNNDFSRNLFNDLNSDIYAHSWYSVITETYVSDDQLLIGEKIFKPMWCSSPFMVLSTRGTLARLRQAGFKTFDCLWDESYDLLPLAERLPAIVKQIKKTLTIDDKVEWIKAAQPVLEHNRRMVMQPWQQSRDYQRMVDIWYRFAL